MSTARLPTSTHGLYASIRRGAGNRQLASRETASSVHDVQTSPRLNILQLFTAVMFYNLPRALSQGSQGKHRVRFLQASGDDIFIT